MNIQVLLFISRNRTGKIDVAIYSIMDILTERKYND